LVERPKAWSHATPGYPRVESCDTADSEQLSLYGIATERHSPCACAALG